MIRPLRPDQQNLVISTLEQASALSQENMDPSVAIAKAAKATGLPENFLQYAVNAYNTGYSLANIKSGSTREEKASSVPLASLDKVMDELYPSAPVKKASVSSEYKTPPKELLNPTVARKSASLRSQQPAYVASLNDLIYSFKSAKEELGKNFQLYKRAQAGIQGYLDNVRHMRLDEVLSQSETAFGDIARVVLEPLHDHCANSKSAKAGPVVRISQKPFNMVKEAVDHLETIYKLGIDCGQKEVDLLTRLDADDRADDFSTRKIAQLTRAELFPEHKPVRPLPVNKQAFSMGEYLLKQPASFVSTVKTAPTAKAKAPVDPKVKPEAGKTDKPGTGANATVSPSALFNPPQKDELSALNKSVSLNSLLRTDPDLQSYRQDQLSRAFNEIQTAFPSVASNPVTLRPFLQRHLTAGGLDDFALKNLADQERALSQAKSTPGL